MARTIIKANYQVMYRTSMRSLTPEEIGSPVEKQARLDFDTRIEEKYGPTIDEADFKDYPDFADFATRYFEPYEYDKVPPSQMPVIEDIDDVDTYDQYVGSQFRVPICDESRSGKVMRHKHELDVNVKGRANANSMLDTRTYEIEFPDGCSDEYTTHIIAENMYAQCDEEGNQSNFMGSTVDHKTDGHPVDGDDVFIKHGSRKQVRNTTKGWHLYVEWIYGTTS
jgi:hypothetical protein